MFSSIPRTAGIPTRTVTAVLTAIPVILITVANLPALMLWSFRQDNQHSKDLLAAIVAWTEALSSTHGRFDDVRAADFHGQEPPGRPKTPASQANRA